MIEHQPPQENGGFAPAFGLDVPLHDLLTSTRKRPDSPPKSAEPQKLPEPIFPQYPELLNADCSEFEGPRDPENPYPPKNGSSLAPLARKACEKTHFVETGRLTLW